MAIYRKGNKVSELRLQVMAGRQFKDTHPETRAGVDARRSVLNRTEIDKNTGKAYYMSPDGKERYEESPGPVSGSDVAAIRSANKRKGK